MNSVQQAREALGARLRELRQSVKPKMTGRQLAERLGWPQSKISKLETGRQTPTEDDLVAWSAATGAGEKQAAALLSMLHTLESAHAEWQRLLSGGARSHQDTWARMERRAARLRVFEPAIVPGLLQTAGYARYRLAQAITVFGVANDIDEAVRARMARQEVLYDSRKRFHLVVTEAALRQRLCPPEVMLPQLDRLVAASTLQNVRLGIIGMDAAYVIGPGHGFWIFDDDRVIVEIFSAELTLAQSQEIELYGTVFGAMASVASYGSKARALLSGLMEELRAVLPADPESESEPSA